MSQKMIVFRFRMSMTLAMLLSLLLFPRGASAQSNSQFYGTFNFTLSDQPEASCKFTIGEDPDQNDLSSSYIYVPVSGTFHEGIYTFNFPYGAGAYMRKVTIEGNTIKHHREESCRGVKLIHCVTEGTTITFNSDYTGGTIQRVGFDRTSNPICFFPNYVSEGSFTRSGLDNSRFFGSYDVISKTGACLEEAKKLTFGDDFSRRYEDDYIYLHRSLTSYTLYEDAEGNGSRRDIAVSDNSITIDEVGRYGASMKWFGPSAPSHPPQEGWEYHYVIDLSFGDPPTITISGHEVDDDPNKCQGDVTASGEASVAVGNGDGTSSGSGVSGGSGGGGGGGCFINTTAL